MSGRLVRCETVYDGDGSEDHYLAEDGRAVTVSLMRSGRKAIWRFCSPEHAVATLARRTDSRVPRLTEKHDPECNHFPLCTGR